MPTLGECAYFSDNAYGNPWGDFTHNLRDSWNAMQSAIDASFLDNSHTGFRAHVYHNASKKKVVIAFAGTNDIRDTRAC